MDRAKHAFGALENVDAAIESGKVDSFDILFVKDSEGKPYVGWVSRDGQKEIVDPYAEVAKLETQLETELATKANAEEVATELATKANAIEVNEKLDKVATESVATAKAYTDGKIEAAIAEHLVKKYEVTSVPVGTLVDYREDEIRIMCPEGTVFAKQSVGAGGDANTNYLTFKTYVFDDNIVGYREHLNGEVDSEILTDLKTDEYGRRYQPTWLGLAKYDEATGTWNYYGKTSSVEKYIGWDYQIDWYNADGVMVASDSIRINLANEDCYSDVKPYYIGGMMKEIEDKIAKATEGAIEVVEF